MPTRPRVQRRSLLPICIARRSSTTRGAAEVKVYSGNTDVTSKFTVDETIVFNNQGTIGVTPVSADAGTYTVKAKFAGVESNALTLTIAKKKISTLTPGAVSAPTSAALQISATAPTITFTDATYGALVTATANPADWVETDVGGTAGTWED